MKDSGIEQSKTSVNHNDVVPSAKVGVKQYYIAFLDILGSKNKIKENEVESLYKIRTIYEFALNGLSSVSIKKTHLFEKDDPEICVKIFSDNILVAIEVNQYYQKSLDDLDNLLHFCTVFQIGAHTIAKWSVRGGITIGNLYFDDTFVWGSGLVRAYELESKNAINPRIILDPACYELITRADALSNACAMDCFHFLLELRSIIYPRTSLYLYYHDLINMAHNLLNSTAMPWSRIIPGINLIHDEDGLRYLSFEEYPILHKTYDTFKGLTLSLQNQLIEILNNPKHDIKTEQKIKWAVMKHNMICEKYNLNQDFIDVNNIQMENIG